MSLILEEPKILKLHEASVQRFCQGSPRSSYFILWQILKLPLQKVILKKCFFDFTKWLKAYETGNPIFINKILKQ